MQIINGILHGADGKSVRWRKATSSGGAIAPRFIVMHDTAGRLSKYNSVDWFANPACKVSAHFVIERDGTITQMVRTDRRAFHAGVSSYRGVSGLNSCSVGIEIVNPGKMDETGKAWFGPAVPSSDLVRETTPEHGRGHWLPYTEAQIKASVALCRALVDEYPDCNEIITHWQISPGRKIDTNPLFPLEDVRRAVFSPAEAPSPVSSPVANPVAAPDDPPGAAVPDNAGPGNAAPGNAGVGNVPVPDLPPPVKEAARSRTVWALLTVVAGKVGEWLFGIGTWLAEMLDSVTTAIGSAQRETDATLAPIASLGKKLALNFGSIMVWATVAILIVCIMRHTRDKVALASAKSRLPDDGT